MVRIVQLLLCVAAASEVNSCDEKSSMLSLARNHSRCGLREERVTRVLEAGILIGKKWSRSDAEAWLCERSHPGPLTLSSDPWADMAEAMSKVQWDKIQWPNSEGGTNNFAYGGAIATGLMYTVAFAESIMSGGPVKWGDFVQGIGTVIGSVLTDLGGLMGPILGACLTFALSLFGSGGVSISDQLEKALQKLYQQIMSEVKDMMQQQQVEMALQQGRDAMTDLMRVVVWIPTNIHAHCQDQCTKEEIRLNTITELLGVKKNIEDHFSELFGSGVHCVEGGERVENPPPECLQFLQQGALFFQFQAAMLHLNTLARLTSMITDKDGQNQTAQELRTVASSYLPYLQWALLGFLSGPELHCSYNYPSGWDTRWGQFEDTAQYTGTTSWKGFDVVCQTACNPTPEQRGITAKDICETGHAQPNSCWWGDGQQFGPLYDLVFQHAKYTNRSFVPMLEAVENLTKPMPDALGMVFDLVDNAKPPATGHNQTFINSTKFCDVQCEPFFWAPNCPNDCLNQVGNLVVPTTRCDCFTRVCPKLDIVIALNCAHNCKALFPMIPDEGTEGM